MTVKRHTVGEQAKVVERILGQSNPADANAVSIYTPAASVLSATITKIIVANVTGDAGTFRIFLDNDGTTYSAVTALYYDVAIAANTTTQIEGEFYMDTIGGNLAIRSANANRLCFTVFGVEVKSR